MQNRTVSFEELKEWVKEYTLERMFFASSLVGLGFRAFFSYALPHLAL